MFETSHVHASHVLYIIQVTNSSWFTATCTALVWTLELHYLMTQFFMIKIINHSLFMYMKIEVAGCSTTCTWLYIRLFHVSAFSFAGLWDSFLELRIRLQKALLVANKLPQQKQIEEFKSSGDKNLKDEYKQGTVIWHLMLEKSLHNFFFNFWHGPVWENPSTPMERTPLNY